MGTPRTTARNTSLVAGWGQDRVHHFWEGVTHFNEILHSICCTNLLKINCIQYPVGEVFSSWHELTKRDCSIGCRVGLCWSWQSTFFPSEWRQSQPCRDPWSEIQGRKLHVLHRGHIATCAPGPVTDISQSPVKWNSVKGEVGEDLGRSMCRNVQFSRPWNFGAAWAPLMLSSGTKPQMFPLTDLVKSNPCKRPTWSPSAVKWDVSLLPRKCVIFDGLGLLGHCRYSNATFS